MSVIFLTLVIFVLSTSVFASDLVLPHCKLPVELGTTPCKQKPSIRYHLDEETELCLAFEYTGCGGNTNNFETEYSCLSQCLPMDRKKCPADSKPLPNTKACQHDSECGPNGYCTSGSRFGICCDKNVRDKLNSDYEPKCPSGKQAHKTLDGGISTVLVGKNCKSKFCPAGATCVDGNYLAACCK